MDCPSPQVYCALRKDKHRKPGTAIWPYMASAFNAGVETVSLEASFYVGDAAGRKGDHDNSDQAFAEAVGLHFFTERQFFQSEAGNHPLPALAADSSGSKQ